MTSGWIGDLQDLLGPCDRHIGIEKQFIEQSQRFRLIAKAGAEPFAQIHETTGLAYSLKRNLCDSSKEEPNPVDPITVSSDSLQQVIVILAMSLNVRG